MGISRIEADQVQRFYGALEAVRTITTGDITLSGVQNINGDTGAVGHRVFANAQTDPTENGLYIMQTGAWTLANDADTDDDVGSMLFMIEAGNNAGQEWKIDQLKGAAVVGTDNLTASLFDDGAAAANRVFGEAPAVVSGNTTVTLANSPSPVTTLRVYRNGQRLNEGVGNDYTLSGAVITFAQVLGASTVIIADYEY